MQGKSYVEDDAESLESAIAADDEQQGSSQTAASQGRLQQGLLQQGLSLDASFGNVIRRVAAGSSFGELALLHKHARRTATVLTATVEAPRSAGESASPSAQGVDLIKISRKDYDLTVDHLVHVSVHVHKSMHASVHESVHLLMHVPVHVSVPVMRLPSADG